MENCNEVNTTDGTERFLIYGLVDPKSDRLRYVGYTTSPERREFEHLVSRTKTVTERTKLGGWIRNLRRRGLTPKFVEMEWCQDLESTFTAEEFWIFYHREETDADLLNVLDGGLTAVRAMLVAELNGYIIHDGRRWKTESVLKKSSVEPTGAELLLPVLGFDCEPSEGEFFERNGVRYLNTYCPPKVEPKQGEHPVIDRLLSFICDGDAEAVRYLTHWIARKIQEPDRRNMTAIVLQGRQGTGKDFLASVVMEMVGRDNSARIGQSAIETSFNGHYAEKLLVIADEVVNRENLFDTASTLKQLITDETVMMNQKFAPQRMVTNRSSWIFTSNDTVPVRIEGKNDRRYNVFYNPSSAPVEHQKMLAACFGKGTFSEHFIRTEIAAFMFDLLHLDVDDELLRKPYENAAREEIIVAGQNSVEAFCDLLKEIGIDQLAVRMAMTTLSNDPLTPSGIVRAEQLFEMYREFCSNFNFRPFNNSKFGSELRRSMPQIERRKRQGPKRSSTDARIDRHERFWVYDGLPVSESAKTSNEAGAVIEMKPMDSRAVETIDELFAELLKK